MVAKAVDTTESPMSWMSGAMAVVSATARCRSIYAMLPHFPLDTVEIALVI